MEHYSLKELIKRVLKKPVNWLKKKSLKIEDSEIKSVKTCLSGRVILATKRGLFVIQGKKIKRILKGEFYGITTKNKKVYVFQKLWSEGRVIKFDLNFKCKIKEVITDLSPGCHQIDFVRDDLFITDTYNNRILKYNLQGQLLQSYYPIGKLSDGRDSENYGHINSIFYRGKYFYLMCHNETKKTEKFSQILKCNKNFNVLETIEIEARNAHNVIVWNGDVFYCDSFNYSFKRNSDILLKTQYFTRGLSMNNSHIFVGGSEIAERGERKNAKGCLFILNKDFTIKEFIEIPGMVQEIRCLDEVDYSLSNNNI